MPRKSKKQDQFETLERIKRSVTDWMSYYSENIARHKRWQKAVYQPKSLYDLEEYSFYKQSGRPTLTFNLLQRETNAMVAEYSSNIPHTKVRSENQDNSQQEDVDLVDKLLRTIALDSRAAKAYKKAFKDMIIGGWGAFKNAVVTDETNPFRDVIRVEECDTPINVGWDTLASEDNKQDGRICFDLQQMSLKEFKRRWPGVAQPNPLVGDGQFKWQTEDNIVIVNFWERKACDRDITLLSDGAVIDTDKVEDYLVEKNVSIQDTLESTPDTPIAPVEIVGQKTVEKFRVTYYRAVYGAILEEKLESGTKLPWVQMCGPKEIIDGKEVVSGLIEWLVAPQMEYNFGANDHIYQVITKSNAQFMGTKDMIPADQQKAWTHPQQKQGMLIYQADDEGRKPEVLPQQSISNDSQMVVERALASFQNISGRFNASIGQQSNEVSGKAVIARQRASNINTKDFYDSARLAQETGAIGQLDLIPHVYDTERTMSLLNPEGKEETVTLNASNGTENKIQEGVYSVAVTMGNSFDVQRADNVDQLIAFGASHPAIAPLTADLIATNLDIKNKDKLVDRIQRYTIPEIAMQEGSKDPIVIENAQKKQQPDPMAQISQQVATLTLQEKQLDIQRKEQDMMLDKIEVLSKKVDDRLDALSRQTSANANMLNAHTTRDKAGVDAMLDAKKIEAEEDRTEFEIQKEALQTLKKGAEDVR